MKVVEKLFLNYLQTPSDEYVNKFLAAKAVLDITEDFDSEVLVKVTELRDRIHDRSPISVFRAQKFLKGKETNLSFRKADGTLVDYSKRQGDDYRLAEYLGEFLDKLNTLVVHSMKKYNSDRGRALGAELEFPEY